MHFKFGQILVFLLFSVCAFPVFSQETNPVDREVANPVRDDPDVNPVANQNRLKLPRKNRQDEFAPEGGGDEVVIYSENQDAAGEEGKRVISADGNVDVRYGIYRLQADKITYYEETGNIIAEGSVVFDQGEDQRITGSKAVWNVISKLGKFEESTGYTNQTSDGTIIYFTAERVERTGLREVVVENGKFTACEDAVPNWSFTTERATIIQNDKIKLEKPKFRLRDVPVFVLPYASIPIEERNRQSGFLMPTVGFSANKGFRFSGAYFQTLGRSADVTLRADLFSARGVGYGADFRTRANSRSFLNFGFYGVLDRILGVDASPENPDQGGASFYADGVHYFPNGFTAVADVRITSNLAFRQIFSDGIQQIISPIEVSEAFVNKSWDNYTLNLLARSQVTSIPNVSIKTRNFPSINFEKRPSLLSFFDKVYFSFKTSLEGISKRERADDLGQFRQEFGTDPLVGPTIGQRFDINPEILIPLNFKYFSVTAKAGTRVTYYSNSLNQFRNVVGRDVIRKYGEFELDFRPVALARNFYGKADAFRFRHVIEPYLTYRLISGVNNFNRIIRFDYADTFTDTNEIEYGITNRIYTRKYTEAVTREAQEKLRTDPDAKQDPLSIQPYEIFTLTVRGKYFFNEDFGGALIPGQRNQIQPISALTFYTFGGIKRRLSPLNIDATYRPRKTVFVNSRMDVGVARDGLRAISATVGYDTRLLKFFQTFYYTRAVTLTNRDAIFSNQFGKEAGTLRGSQWSPSIFAGDKNKGFYGGTSLFFDFQNRRARGGKPLISSLFTLGYASDCCAVTGQFYTFNVGVRRENRFVFSFRLNGIGTFGTEQFGQGGF